MSLKLTVGRYLQTSYSTGMSGDLRGAPDEAIKGAVDRYGVGRRWLMFGEGTMDGKGADRILEGLDDDDKAEVMRFIDFVRTRKVKMRGIR